MARNETVVTELNVVKSNAYTRSFIYKSARRSVRLIGADMSATHTLVDGDDPIVLNEISSVLVVDAVTKVKLTIQATDTSPESSFYTKFMVLHASLYKVTVERDEDTDASTNVGLFVYWS